MLLAVVSDTHRDQSAILEVCKKLENVDVVIHLGDCTSDVKEIAKRFNGRIISVRGNCDYTSSAPSELIVEIEGIKFFITHGHNYGVKQGIDYLKKIAVDKSINIALFGHTHKSYVACEGGIWYINPGSAAQARDRVETIAMIELKQCEVNPWLVVL